MDTLPEANACLHARQGRPCRGEPRHDVVGPDRPGQPGVHVEDGLCDEIYRFQRVESAEDDAVGWSPEEAANEPARIFGDDERRIETVEPRFVEEASEQAEGQVVLGFVCTEKRAGAVQEGARIVQSVR